MNMVPPSSSTHTSSGPPSMIPAPAMPRQPNAQGPGSSTMSGHPGPAPSRHPSMSAPYGHMNAHHYQQQPSRPIGSGPNNGQSYSSMSTTSPRGGRSMNGPPPVSASGPGPGPNMHPNHAAHTHGPAPSQFHHPLHSPSGMRQSAHHHPPPMPSHHQHMHPMHPPQPHHMNMPPHQPPPHHQQQYYQHPPQHSSNHMMQQTSSASSVASSNQQVPPPPQYLSNTINGNWQSDMDMNHRRDMIKNIYHLLKEKDKNNSPEWLSKLPQMVKQLEVSLYRSAPSFDAYVDKNTLKDRLQVLAMEIAKKTNGPGKDENQNTNNVNGGDNQRDSSNSSRSDSQLVRGGSYPPHVHSQPPSTSRQSSEYHSSIGKTPPDPRGGLRMDPPPHPSQYSQWPQNPRSGGPAVMPSRESSNTNGIVNLGQINGMLSNGPGSVGNSRSSEPEWELRIRHKQQRLLLLHHSSKCQNADGQCPVTPHCADMKKLWHHMAKCEDNRCEVRHCYSSRAILSHYRKCNDKACQACAPVRKAVAESSSSPSGSKGFGPPFAGEGIPQRPQSMEVATSGGSPFPPPQAQLDPKVKHKQQRLLLLRHASKCEAKDGECRTTPHCVEMKKLWKHISDCQIQDCKYPHCLSSRYVLMHYRRCKDKYCQSCAPLRDRRPSSEKQSYRSGPNSNDETNKSGSHDSRIKVEESKPSTAIAKNEDLSFSIINNFSLKQIELHLESLNKTYLLPQRTMKEKCFQVLKTLQDHEYFWVFAKPVDPVELGLSDYFDVIKNPMDLGTVQKKLETGQYRSIDDFCCDVRLTFDNALMYNEEGSVVNGMATDMKKTFEKKHENMLLSLQREEEERKNNERACALCGFEKLQFEPPVFFCYNLKCANQRIHRNRHFYTGGNNQYNYCTQCYNDLDDGAPIEFPDVTLKKSDLKKKKNDEVHEENWVQCDVCERWIHQICGLFNPRQNTDNQSTYSCPKCLLEERKRGKLPGKAGAPLSQDLPRTKLSEFIESYIEPRVKAQHIVVAKEKAELEKIPFEEAHRKIMESGKITIRQVASTDKKIEVREKMRAHYAHKNYPEEFLYRCKCLLVFQNIDGADTILFALYVYEHGKDNPLPNQRTVYISYLDSVYYMRPRRLRTFVYHEILTAYLEYARRAGFAKAHIWACPPLKGDDYIFYAKPEDQKTPKDKMLTQWYIDMLTECQKRDIVGKLTNIYDLYFTPGTFDATALPYLEGDYFSSEIEIIIKDLEEGKGSKSGSNGKKNNKKKGGDKSKNGRKGTRAGGTDDDMSDLIKDPVMVKLGERIKDMKQTFIVAYLNWEGARPEDKEVPQEILDERERRKTIKDDPEIKSRKRDSDGNLKNTDEKENNILDDDAEEIIFEIFDTRQEFLNLCKGNHYQFDTPRRAKHTSMMVLWHLHNKNAAKFVQSCINCTREILSGIRYTCESCTDIDLCGECYSKPNINRGLCTHELVPKQVDPNSNQSGAGSNGNLTEAQRKARQIQIEGHIKLLEHTSQCEKSECSAHCVKMKQYLKHYFTCKQKVSGGCKVCRRVLTLVKYHATRCKSSNCRVPQCNNLRERMLQLRRQQQAMDDRRRHMINQQYRSSYNSS